MSGSYKDAPATKMLDIQCAICGEELVDAKSIEYGMGPHCRREHGFMGKNAPQVSEEDRIKANRIVYSIASGLPNEYLGAAIKDLRDMGFSLLASVLEDRKVSVSVTSYDIANLVVRFAYNEAVIAALKASVPGRRWNKEEKAWTVPATQAARAALWEVIKKHFSGQLIKTERGVDKVP